MLIYLSVSISIHLSKYLLSEPSSPNLSQACREERSTRLENERQCECKIGKNATKSLNMCSFWVILGCPKRVGCPVRFRRLSGASRGHLGKYPGRPGSARAVTRGTPGRQKVRPGASRSAPRRPKLTPSRVRERNKICFLVRRVRQAMLQRFVDVFYRFPAFS